MTIDQLTEKTKRLEEIKERIKKRKEGLSDLRYPLGKQIIEIGYNTEVGYMNSRLYFTGNEIKKILENSIKDLEAEMETILKEMNGQVIEIQKERK